MLAQGSQAERAAQSRAALVFAYAVIRAVASADTAHHNGGRDPVAMLARN
jgi:hypothetical protein